MDKKQLLSSLKSQGFPPEILNAFKKVSRENFIPKNLKSHAYRDTALPLKPGATISQPYTISFMLNLLELNKLKENSKILEIGSGSGYVLALLSEILKNKSKIYGVEILRDLAQKSKKALSKYKNIRVFHKNGSHGLPKYAPYDRILISAAAKELPKHPYKQLKSSAILVAPIKNSIFQIKKQNSRILKKEFHGFAFVPLTKTK